MEHHDEEYASTNLNVNESYILFFLQTSRFPEQVAVMRETVMFQEQYWSHQPFPQKLSNQSKRKAVANHFSTSADHIYPTASFLHQDPHKRIFLFSYKCNLMYKASPDTINTYVLTGNVVSHRSQLDAAGWSLYSSSLRPSGPAMQEFCDKTPAALLHVCQSLSSAFAPWITSLPYFSARLSKT